ncbi:hypothetical protein MXB_5568 [Myxobolus squamalis]|nr:hypothetical protein MXB_5568 [Myxobolus squamalis]
MRECISINIGQAGSQIGSSCWKLYTAEHKISPTGQLLSNNPDIYNTTFFEDVRGKFIPRNIFVDTESSVLDEIRTGEYSDLFNPDRFVNTMEDAANNYARGLYTLSRSLTEKLDDVLRLTIEGCENLQGFMFFNSFGGGTGSGYTPYLQQRMQSLYPKKTTLTFGIFPCLQRSTANVEPYNTIFGLTAISDISECTFLMDNDGLFNVCSNNLSNPYSTYTDINHIVAQAASSISCSIRFPGSLNVDLVEFPTNLIPFSSLMFPVISYAPLNSVKVEHHQNITVSEITNSCAAPSNQLFRSRDSDNVHMSCCLLYRGDVCHRDINQAINDLKMKSRIKFCDWTPTGFKVGINSCKPVFDPIYKMAKSDKSLCMLSNSTAVVDPFARIMDAFQMMYRKLAFVHWYQQEGMELCEFNCAVDRMYDIITKYDKINE